MVGIARIVVTDKFEKDVRKIRDKAVRERIDREIKKIAQDPNIGKSLGYGLKGERAVRINPYRLIYQADGENLILLRFEHRKGVYE